MDVVLVGVLAAALGGHVHHRTFEQFEQALLDALAAHVAGDGGIVALAGNLVDFVDEHDAALGALHVIVGHLQEAGQDAFYIFAHVAGLGKHRGIDNGEGHIEEAGNGAGQKGLARTRRADHDDVRLFDFHTVVVLRLLL